MVWPHLKILWHGEDNSAGDSERRNSAAEKKKKKLFFLSSGRHGLTYIEMFVSTSSLRKLMLTSWYFGEGGDILAQKHAFLTKKMRKTGIIFQNSRHPSQGRNFAWLTSERVLNKTCDVIINENLYL